MDLFNKTLNLTWSAHTRVAFENGSIRLIDYRNEI